MGPVELGSIFQWEGAVCLMWSVKESRLSGAVTEDCGHIG